MPKLFDRRDYSCVYFRLRRNARIYSSVYKKARRETRTFARRKSCSIDFTATGEGKQVAWYGCKRDRDTARCCVGYMRLSSSSERTGVLLRMSQTRSRPHGFIAAFDRAKILFRSAHPVNRKSRSRLSISTRSRQSRSHANLYLYIKARIDSTLSINDRIFLAFLSRPRIALMPYVIFLRSQRHA